MSSDSQFTAHGPAIIGFQTNASDIDQGADISGKQRGIRGHTDQGIGIVGQSAALANGAPGTSVGVLGEGQSVGVRGTSSNTGVEGIGGTGAGVSGRGWPGVIGRGDRSMGNSGVVGVMEGTDGSGVFGGHRLPGNDPLGVTSFAPSGAPGAGVYGVNNDDGAGVQGASRFGHGVKGTTDGGVDLRSHGVFGVSSKTAGVVGISGRVPAIEMISPPVNSGVFGYCAQGRGIFGQGGDQGVVGLSVHGEGVTGRSQRGRGGVFASGSEGQGLKAQLQLVPQPLPVPETVPAQPMMFVSNAVLLSALPRSGRAGDILATKDPSGAATLWFCTQGEDGTQPAQWSQMLFGPPLPGGG